MRICANVVPRTAARSSSVTHDAGDPGTVGRIRAEPLAAEECTPGNWCVSLVTTRLPTMPVVTGRDGPRRGLGAWPNSTENTTSIDARERNANLHLEEPSSSFVVRSHRISSVRRFGYVAARGLCADFSRTIVAAAPIVKRIHQLRELP